MRRGSREYRRETMGRLPDFLELERHGLDASNVLAAVLRCRPEEIRERVALTPVWGARLFEPHARAVTTIVEDMVWELTWKDRPVTVVRSGIGAPQTGDVVLALGLTRCTSLVLTGSVGGLQPSMRIGDLLLAEQALCGDGFTRYLHPGMPPADRFLEPVPPDESLTEALGTAAAAACGSAGVPLHCGPVFTIDTILAQFSRLERLAGDHRCIGVEMETAAVFGAARLCGIRAAALLQVSDVLPLGKTLFAGRTAREDEERKRIRTETLARIVLEALCAGD